MPSAQPVLPRVLADLDSVILQEWLTQLRGGGANESGRITDAQLANQASSLLQAIRAASSRSIDADHPALTEVRELIADISRARAVQGYLPREVALFVFSLKPALFSACKSAPSLRGELAQLMQEATALIDNLGLYAMEVFQRSREEVIVRQQREISELSTPVVKLWDGILALPIIGTLDSERTQVVMENLLQSIVDFSADIAIIDITGVPTVDTLTAQHLLKTIAAARLMGADCIISGIRPQIAQTMVHLGVELKVISKATLADAFALALRRVNKVVVPLRPAAADTAARVE